MRYGVLYRELLAVYLEKHSTLRHQPKTTERHRVSARSLLPFFGDLDIEKITDGLIDDYQLHRRSRGVSPRTMNIETACLAASLRVGLRWGWVKSLPFSRIYLLREPPGRVRYLDDDERHRLLSACHEPLRSIVLFAMNTGMRRNEILRLRWKDCLPQKMGVFLRETKNGKPRTVPLNETSLTILRSQPRQLRCEYVFHHHGKAYREIAHAFRRAVARAGIPDFRFHDLRHCFASYAVQAGVPLNTVREILGHADMRMTLRYAHLSPEISRTAVEKLDVLFREENDPAQESLFS